jgi:tryptophan synthase
MAVNLRKAFAKAKSESTKENNVDRPVFVPYVTAGYPSVTDTVDIMLALQQGGADIIEIGRFQ